MKQIEATGKKIDDAINAGLKELGVTLSEVNVEILEQGGFFRKAKVRLTVEDDEDLFVKKTEKPAASAKSEKPAAKPEKPAAKAEKPAEAKKADKPAAKQDRPAPEKSEKKENKPAPEKSEKKENKPAPERKPAPQRFEKRPSADTRPAPVKAETEKPETPARPVDPAQVKMATDYLSKVLSLMSIAAELKADTSHGSIDIDVVTDDASVIGHRGEVLDALQILAKRAVEEGDDKFVHVNVDSRNYRVKREQSLVALANRMAAKCVRTGRKVVLEPMSSTHRKIIHAALTDNDKVITKSEGKDPNRKVVILPKRY